ncbi:tail fiber protein [Plantibacter sp. Mn2098]|uniref:tail fiber protein n=1 Tax=Plantibacter sp. Mn2098 TaxID=3395266 RepID=UPI003BD7F136
MTQQVPIRAGRSTDSLGSRASSSRRTSGTTAQQGFALPAVLIVSVILLMLLVTGMSATVAVNNGLRDQHYTKLAELATDAGNEFATACFEQSGNQISWTNEKPLRPNTDCAGNIDSSASAYVIDRDGIRTFFVVDGSAQAKGYTEGVRSSTNLAWRVWTSSSANAVAVPVSTMPVGSIISLAWTSGTTAPDGYLWTDGQCVSRTTYSALFAKFGTAYEADITASFGWGACASSEFRLPLTNDRVLVDLGSDGNFNAVGKHRGATTHTLTSAQVPPLQITRSGSNQVFVQSNGNDAPDNNGYSNNRFYMGSGGSPYPPVIANGGGQAHNIVQPSVVVRMAIKY